ncbi:leucine-rich repeat-containing protein 49 [Acanthopagrus latus]|uniref:leucine-rich repeat-containing protein 49 n=1 Tax=Acanthopagrus latus TaxID=8177 RepID=UPI00187CF6C6|nr:leucine-rich repeat-containing protein 49 [Acanthopagrus latus]XP_036951166.1 leucine-rich repeat-containing protein 49 [Acanthopagrus latus]XP_036951167.1 leucine-rich repeat-containing protein 49 [Acanthopagrus latus]
MESERSESKTMRAQKRNSGASDRWDVLAPRVNSCKLHLTTVKSLVPEGAQRMTESQVLVKEKYMNSPQTINHPKPENRSLAHSHRGRVYTSLAPSFASDSTYSSVGVVAGGAHCGLEVASCAAQDARDKPRRPTHSAWTSYHRNVSNLPKPAGGSGGYKWNTVPGFPPTRLPWGSFASSFQRIDLDRHCLEECPQLGIMDGLQLLNLQHNLITKIQHLSQLQQLVFLNLCDNHISEMTGIEALSSLRILMLGKNRINKISCLEGLSHLNILDLHDNQICQIENMSHLSELRVLNLAGNSITRVEKLQGLDCLTELHLRHNSISIVTEVDRLPCLQRLFLSCNNITSFDQLACLGESRSLSELTLDGNPVALETWYKQAVLRCVLHLRQLDMKRITDEDRRMAGVQARKEEEKKRESHKQTIHKEKRRLAIRNAAQQWEGVRACLELPPTNGAKEEVSPENSPAHSPAQTNGLAQEPSPDEPRRVSPGSGPERPSGGTEIRLRTNSRPNSPRDPKLVEAGSGSVQSLSLSDSHLAELDGDTLRLFGLGALEALERGWGVQTAGAVTVITFRYINFDAIVPTLPRIRVKFPNLSHMIFLETNISRLPQLAALAQVRRLDQLTIHPEGNPVVSLALWRSFVIYRLHHFNLQRINGQEVTMNDVIAAERVFGTLGHIAATETPRCRLLLLLEESRKRQLQFLLDGRGRRAGLSPEELRDNGKLLGEGLSRALFNYPSRDCSADSPEEGTVESSERAAMIEQYLQELVQRASDTNLKGEALHKLWPSMFAEMVRDCVLEMRDRAAFRQASLAKLTETK